MACVYYFYKIYCKDDSVKDIYVGSHKDTSDRESNHRHTCNNTNHKDHHYKVYQCIRKHGGWDNWIFQDMHCEYCETKLEARKIEQSFIDDLGATLNDKRAYISAEQLKIENKKRKLLYYSSHKEQAGKYYIANKQQRIKYARERYKIKKKCEVCNTTMSKHDYLRHSRTKKHKKNVLLNK